MPGNSNRRGAVRKRAGGNPTAGSGGRVRRGLEGKGPTPKAAERENHKAYKAKKRAEASSPQQRPRRSKQTDTEWVAGRNSVVEALRAGIPATTVYVAEGAERDGRLREAFRIVAERVICAAPPPHRFAPHRRRRDSWRKNTGAVRHSCPQSRAVIQETTSSSTCSRSGSLKTS